jgi:hypothetical protein
MAQEFDMFVLYEHNYPTWAMDVKNSLELRGMFKALTPTERQV